MKELRELCSSNHLWWRLEESDLFRCSIFTRPGLPASDAPVIIAHARGFDLEGVIEEAIVLAKLKLNKGVPE